MKEKLEKIDQRTAESGVCRTFSADFLDIFCHLQYSQNIVEISVLIVLDVSGILDYICVDYITIGVAISCTRVDSSARVILDMYENS